MADHAALISLNNTLELILRSDRFSFFHARQQIVSLYRKLRCLRGLLRDSPPRDSQGEMNLLQARIAKSAYAIEDAVEINVVAQILSDPKGFMESGGSSSVANHKASDESMELEGAVGKMDSILEEVLNGCCGLKSVLPRRYSHVGSLRRVENIKSNMMVGFDEDMMTLKDRLIGYESKLQIIPIVGMGGSGKTTLAMNLYNDSLFVYHFDICAWVTISQTYVIEDVLQALLKGIGVTTNEKEENGSRDSIQILYKCLKDRRYLIVLDDIWSTEIWDGLRIIFPDDANRSRIVITTRIDNLAKYATDSSSPAHKIRLLDDGKSWNLLCHKVFWQEDCPLKYRELKDIGKMIARNCRGLPLTISVIGGLLVKSSMTREFWEYVAGNINSIALESDEHCFEILSLSYNYLPDHLKPCFLYFGAFPKGYEISTAKLVRLWIAEGFLKPIRSKTWEQVAKEYLNDLIDRNLVFVGQKGSNGKEKTCIMHDLLRDLCVKEAEKENFLHTSNRYVHHSPFHDTNIYPRLLSIHQDILNDDDISDYMYGRLHKSISFTRSLLCTGRILCATSFYKRFRLLRVLDFLETRFSEFPNHIVNLVTLRYLAFTFSSFPILPSSVMSLLWKLQTLIIRDCQIMRNRETMLLYKESYCQVDLPLEILQMANLRHLQMTECFLPNLNGNDTVILKELISLSTVTNFKCTKGFVRKFPNLRNLGIYYATEINDWSLYHLKNLAHLSMLESLKCTFNWPLNDTVLPNLSFPTNLKKLTLSAGRLLWKDMMIIGSLSHLEVLKLRNFAFAGTVWEAVEGEFCRLKFLQIERTDLVHWIADHTHFPCLKHLKIQMCLDLEEIPSGIGDIASLEMIEINYSSSSAAISAWQILKEQRSMGNDVLQVRAPRTFSHMEDVASHLADRGITVHLTEEALNAVMAGALGPFVKSGSTYSEILATVKAKLLTLYDPTTGVRGLKKRFEKRIVTELLVKLAAVEIDDNSTVHVDYTTDNKDLTFRIENSKGLVNATIGEKRMKIEEIIAGDVTDNDQ